MADLGRLKAHVCALAGEVRFIHSAWFVEHHLLIIEQIVEELIGLYPQANATVARAMVWVHDWAKITTNKGPDEEDEGRRLIVEELPGYGFTADEIALVGKVYDEMEELKSLGADFLLETKVISSADALAHYVGPFFNLYWYENPHKSVDELIEDNMRKVARDERKLMLPEVKRVAEVRMGLVKENSVEGRPKRYL